MENNEDQKYISKLMENIKRIRKQKSMTQFDVAVACGMEENAYQKLEAVRDINPTVKTLIKISRALDVEIIELFDFNK